jgi:hypothetical protein
VATWAEAVSAKTVQSSPDRSDFFAALFIISSIVGVINDFSDLTDRKLSKSDSAQDKSWNCVVLDECKAA